MTEDEDATLEEFIGGESGDGSDAGGEVDEAGFSDDDGSDGEDDESEVGGEDGSDGEGDVEQPAITSRWVPGGAECNCCADATERLWRADDGAFVCTDCSEWE